jgi:PAS domain-containing protein
MARLTTLSERQVRDTFNAQAERLLSNYRPAVPRVMCMDGVYFGRVERALLLDGETGVVFDVFPHAKTWRLYRKILKAITPAQRAAIEVVVTDMSLSLKAVARRAFPNAVIVIDRFHVYNRVNKAMEKIRGALSDQRGRKKGTRKMIRKEIPLQHGYQLEREKNSAALAELRWWRGLLPEFDEAYQMNELFCEIWYSSCVRTALTRYEAWKEKLATCSELVRKHFQKELVGTVDNWETEIFAYFEHCFDNGAVERRNGDVKALQREGKRLSFDAMRAKMVFGTALRQQRAEEAEQHKAERRSRRVGMGKDAAVTRKRKVGLIAGKSTATPSSDTPESDQ